MAGCGSVDRAVNRWRRFPCRTGVHQLVEAFRVRSQRYRHGITPLAILAAHRRGSRLFQRDANAFCGHPYTLLHVGAVAEHPHQLLDDIESA